jgi:hypothetical protein
MWAKERPGDGRLRRLHKEDLHDLYSSPNIIRVIKSRKIRWVGHVARVGENKGGGNLRQSNHSEDLGLDG